MQEVFWPKAHLFLGTFSATLKFKVRDCDPATGEPDTEDGYEDDYTVSFTVLIFFFQFYNFPCRMNLVSLYTSHLSKDQRCVINLVSFFF